MEELPQFTKTSQVRDYNLHRFGEAYPFGVGVRLHEVGDISILEYHPFIDEGIAIGMNYDATRVEFHVRGSHVSYPSLDYALAGALGHKYEGANSQAGRHIYRMLGEMTKPHKDWSYVQQEMAGTGGPQLVQIPRYIVHKIQVALRQTGRELSVLGDEDGTAILGVRKPFERAQRILTEAIPPEPPLPGAAAEEADDVA